MLLIIGSEGQLGKQMQKLLKEKSLGFHAVDFPGVDITDVNSVRKVLGKSDYSCVINCAAYTNVDKAESNEDAAYRVNALGSKYIAQVCEENDIELVHVSTDYVFSGEGMIENGAKRGYIESDICKPVTVYGKTKCEGEKFVRSIVQKHYILRTAWLYGDGDNFVRTILKLAKINDTLRVVCDQFGSPTSTVDLARAIVELIGSGEYGTFHATCEGICSWYDFAKKIIEYAGIDIKVVPVSSEEFVRPAKRPHWSVLENKRLKECGKNCLRDWQESLKQYVENGCLSEN